MKVALNQQGARTSTGTQNWTDTVFTTDFLAGISVGSRATAEAAAAVATGALDVGFTDLTNSLSLGSASQDASAAPGTRGWPSSNSMLTSVNTNGTVRSVAPYNATLNNPGGVQINYTTAPGTSDLVTMLMLGGNDVKFSAVTALFSGSPNNDQTITHGLGGTPDFIMMIGVRGAAFQLVASGHIFGAGFWTSGAQVGFGMQQQNGIAPTNTGAIMRSGDVASFINTTPAIINEVIISAVGSTSFTVSTGGGGSNGAICFLCGRGVTSNMFVKAGVTTTPTATGTQVLNGSGGQPQFLITIPTRLINNALASDDTSGSWGMGLACNAASGTQQHAVAATTQDGVNPSVSKSYCDSKSLLVLDNTGAPNVEATLQSWDSDGVTLNYSNVDPSGLEFLYLMVGMPAPIQNAVAWFNMKNVFVNDTVIQF